MPDESTQCDSVYGNYFLRLFDDIFSIHEETLVPLDDIGVKLSIEDRKKLRTIEAEKIKHKQLRKAHDELTEIRKETEKETMLMISPIVFEKLGQNSNLEDRIQQALKPLDIPIPPVSSDKLMPQWGLGGPSSSQYKLIAHLLQLSREDSRPYFLEMIGSYLAFREDKMIAPRDMQEQEALLRDTSFDKEEERHIMNMFFPNEKIEVKQQEIPENDCPSIGKVFLLLSFLTQHNEAFKTFVKKCFTMKTELREMLAGKFLYKRMSALCTKFYGTKELKYNYVRIAWERKSKYMDDYTVCLILFIHDKTGNITWEEAEDLIHPEARRIIQRSSQIVRRLK